MFQFLKILLGYNFPEKGEEMNKNTNVDSVNLLLSQKGEENIPKFSFLYSSPYLFDTHALTFYYKNLLHK